MSLATRPESIAALCREASVLLVDDSRADLALMQGLLRDLQPHLRIQCATSGRKALTYLRDAHVSCDSGLPGLVLLDLNMPSMNGIEVLKTLRTDPVLHSIPVIITTSSAEQQDVTAAYGAHANAVLKKPRQIDSFRTILDRSVQFWFCAALLPHCLPPQPDRPHRNECAPGHRRRDV